MNTVHKIANDIAQKLANVIVESSSYKVLYEESQEQCNQTNDLLAKFNKVLESDPALKELFDEASAKIEIEEVSE